MKVEVVSGPSEEYTYGLGQLIRDNDTSFFCLQAFQNYIYELQKVHDFYKAYEESIKDCKK